MAVRSIVVPVAVLLLASGCGATAETSKDPTPVAEADGGSVENETKRRPQIETNFTGRITGAAERRIAGPGVLSFFDGSNSHGYSYHFVADDMGRAEGREGGVVFGFPDDPVAIGTGRHILATADPFGYEDRVEARIDVIDAEGTTSYTKEVEGYLELTSYPDPRQGGRVAGSYAFSASDLEGNEARAEGEFDFVAPAAETQ